MHRAFDRVSHQPHIGSLREGSLHAALKRWVAEPGDQVECTVDGYVIDVVRGDTLLEIQTRSFANLKRKLTALLPAYHVHLFYPLPRHKWIVRVSAENDPISRRKSPKRGRPIDAFRELVYIGHLLADPNLTVSLLLTQEDEVWRDDGKGSWRRKRWSIADRVLLDVDDEIALIDAADWLALLPQDLPAAFTNRDLADAARCTLSLAQKTTHTLRRAGLVTLLGKQGRAHLYQTVPPAGAWYRSSN